MKKTLLSITLLCLSSILIAQFPGTDSNWYFGDHAGLTWNQLQANQDPMYIANTYGYYSESTSVISDPMGNLLFYTDGSSVYTSNHTVMPGSLAVSPGGSLNSNPSATQGSQIIPCPGDSNSYYIFTVDANVGADGACYSKVDMTLNGGLGDIVLTEKNVSLMSLTCEKITYAAHADGLSIWVIFHAWDSNAFYSYLVSPAGVDVTNPVISNVGTVITGNISNCRGAMRASFNGSKVAVAIEGANIWEVYDFNRATGELSNAITISSMYFMSPYGLEFSPGGRYLYGSQRWSNKVYQWDISHSDSLLINSSQVQIGTLSTMYGGSLLLGPDFKIYLSANFSNYVGRINNPDLHGLLCGFVENAVLLGANLTTANSCTNGFPGIYRYNAPLIYNSFSYDESCLHDTTFFLVPTSQSFDTAFWNFNYPSTDPMYQIETTNAMATFVYPSGGQYTVELIVLSYGVYDTIYQDVFVSGIPIVNLGPDTTLCPGESLTFDLSFNDNIVVDGQCDYNWQITTSSGIDSSFLPVNTITESGEYIMTVDGDSICGSATDTIEVIYSEIEFDFGVDTVYVQTGNSVILDPGYIGVEYLWSTAQITPTIEVSTEGYYSVIIFDALGCSHTDGVQVIVLSSIENEMLNEIKIFPNPVSSILNINLNEFLAEEILFYNSMGGIVKKMKINESDFNIDIKELPQGNYFLRIRLKNEESIIRQFSILR